MIEDNCGICFPQEWKSRLKNFVAAVLFEFNGLVQKTTLDSCIFQEIMGHLRANWIDDGQDEPGESSNPRARSLNLSEIQKISRVGNCLPCHHQEERFFQDFKSWRSELPEDQASPLKSKNFKSLSA